jgi:hypothetical protein
MHLTLKKEATKPATANFLQQPAHFDKFIPTADCRTRVLQRGISYSVVFIESQTFTRRLHQLAGVSADEVLREIQEDLLRNPEKGDVAQGLGGIRKARTSNPTRGKGKRGGYRYMHLYLKHRDHVHLLFLLD